MRTRDTRATSVGALLAGVAAFVFAIGGALDAQNRMPPIPHDGMTEAQQKAVAEFMAARGGEQPSIAWAPFLRSPELMNRTRAMGDYLRFKSAFTPRLTELVILITARYWTQQHQWSGHRPLAIKAGLHDDVIAAIAGSRRPARMADDEAVLYDLCTQLLSQRAVDDATYTRARAKFGESAVVDAVGIVGYYSLLAMVMNTARVPPPADAAALLPPAPKIDSSDRIR
jgi:4-carboxymuconolactone decarboxylase